MKIPNRNSQDSLEVKMTPMIDVVFLLLVFFVWTSSFEEPEYDLPGQLAELPKTGSSLNPSEVQPTEPFDELIVRLRNEPPLTVIEWSGREFNDVDSFTEAIRQVLELGVQPPVIIDPDATVTMDWAIRVYDASRSAGADRVLFATE
ncbi:MAG: biopolymer transporter ExbD [Planctomycetota bacterium]